MNHIRKEVESLIKIDDHWEIQDDTYGYILTYNTHKIDKSGKELYKNNKYFPSIEGCVSEYLRVKQKEVVSQDVYSLKEAVQALKKVQDEVKKLFLELEDVK